MGHSKGHVSMGHKSDGSPLLTHGPLCPRYTSVTHESLIPKIPKHSFRPLPSNRGSKDNENIPK